MWVKPSLEAPGFHDRLLDRFRSGPGLGLNFVFRPAFQRCPGAERQIVGQQVQGRAAVVTKDERHIPLLMPAIEVPGLGEVGVSPQRDPAEAGLTTERDALVELLGRALVTGPVAGPVLEPQDFPRVGRCEGQRMVAPHALVIDVDPLPALGPCLHSAPVSTIVPSASMRASAKNSSGRRARI